jgi:hypothetical protein
MADDANLDLAIHHVEWVLADQLNSVNSLSNKASVALGFVVTVFGTLFSLSRDAIHSHLVAALISRRDSWSSPRSCCPFPTW